MSRGASRIAVASDMHGNLTAFRAVLADAERRGATAVWCGGDLVGKGPRGRAVVELAREACDVVVRGNWDEVIAVPQTAPWHAPEWYREELGDVALRWLAALPFHHDAVLGGDRVRERTRLFHASPESVHHRVHAGMGDDAHAAMFLPTAATGAVGESDLVLYGDLHRQFVDARRGKRLVNTGSAGNDLAGDPTAAYLLLEPTSTGVEPLLLRVPYDVESEIALARATAMPFADHWVTELRTGAYQRRV